MFRRSVRSESSVKTGTHRRTIRFKALLELTDPVSISAENFGDGKLFGGKLAQIGRAAQ